MRNSMTRGRRAPMAPTAPPDDRLFEVERSQRELRVDLEQLRRELAGEVRTRRLIVEDSEAQTIIEGDHLVVEHKVSGSNVYLIAGSDGGEVRAYSGPDGGFDGEHPDSTTVSVYAGSGPSEGGSGAAAITIYAADQGREVTERVEWLEAQLERQATVIHGAGAVLASLLGQPAEEGTRSPDPVSLDEVDRLRGELANALTVVRMLAAASRTAVEGLSGTETDS